MAQRRSSSSENYDILKFCAYWGLILSGVTGLIGFIIALLNLIGVSIAWAGTLQSICSLLSSIAMLVGVAFGAWLYAKYRSNLFRILYFIAIALYILGIVGIVL